MSNFSFPLVETQVVDNSALASSPSTPRVAMLGYAKRGSTDPVLISNFTAFAGEFGNLNPLSENKLFPFYAQIALRMGAILLVQRVTSAANPPTAPTGTLNGSVNLGVARVVSVSIPTVNSPVVQVNSTQSLALWQSLIGESLSVTTATQSAVLEIAAVAQVSPNLYNITLIDPVPTLVAEPSASGSATVSVAGSVLFTGKTLGAYSPKVIVTNAASGNANNIDVTVFIDNNPDLTQRITDFPKQPTQSQIDAFNILSKYVVITTVTDTVVLGEVTLSGGTEGDLPLMSDYIAALQKLNDQNFKFVCAPEVQTNELDVAINSYCATRNGECLSIHSAPVGATPEEALAYRNGFAPFLGSKIDSYLSSMTFPDVQVRYPLDGSLVWVSPVAFEAAVRTIKDIRTFSGTLTTAGAWAGFGSKVRGRIDAIAVRYNMKLAANKAIRDELSQNNLNFLVQAEDGTIHFYGNQTLQVANTFLRSANISELIWFMQKELKAKLEPFINEPQVPVTWKTIDNELLKFSKFLVQNNAIQAEPAPVILGDGNATGLSTLRYNSVDDIQNGRYRCGIAFVPVNLINTITLVLEVNSFENQINLISLQ